MERDECIRGLRAVEKNYLIAVDATRHLYQECISNRYEPIGYRPRDI